LPGARVAWVETPPASGDGAYRLRMRQAGDPSFRFPHSFVVVEARGGRVLSITDAVRAGPTTTVLNWLHPLHDGSAGGLALRVAVLLAGLGGAMLFATGLWRWLARRRVRRTSAAA